MSENQIQRRQVLDLLYRSIRLTLVATALFVVEIIGLLVSHGNPWWALPMVPAVVCFGLSVQAYLQALEAAS